MSHKSTTQRQVEAKERKRKYLPSHEAKLVEALAYANRHPGEQYAERALASQRDALERLYVEAGYPPQEARGMANAIASGSKKGSWVSSFSRPNAVVQSDASANAA